MAYHPEATTGLAHAPAAEAPRRRRATGGKIALIAALLVAVATVGGIASFESLTSTATNGSDCTGATGNAAGDCWPTTQATGYQMSYTTGAASPNGTWPDSSSTPTVVWYKFAYAISASAPAGGTVQVELTWEAVGL